MLDIQVTLRPPHLHFQLMDSADIAQSNGFALFI